MNNEIDTIGQFADRLIIPNRTIKRKKTSTQAVKPDAEYSIFTASHRREKSHGFGLC
jgi:hypothetical protein